MNHLRLAVFDLDGTLKEARDPYVFVHQRLGTWEESRWFFEKGMAGQLDYDEWLRLDVGLWKGVSRATLQALLRENPYLPGAQEAVHALKQAGVLVAVISTGLRLQAEQVQADLGIDRIVANEVLFEDGVATGEVRSWVPEGNKGRVVADLQAELGVKPAECLAVGDTSSDVGMFRRVRLGVAVNPTSDEVRAAAHVVLEEPDLHLLLAELDRVLPGWVPGSGPRPVGSGRAGTKSAAARPLPDEGG